MRGPCRRRPRVAAIDVLLIAGMALGLALSLRPLLLVREPSEATEAIAQMSATTDLTNDPERIAALRRAQAYNLGLADSASRTDNRGMGGNNGTEGDILELARAHKGSATPYERQLSWNGMSAICWVEIPKIGVRAPAYHGTEEGALAIGVGHLGWSSLPVGGSPSHCVLVAHTGMRTSDMFDDLDRLAVGDVFVLHTLGDCYCYRVRSTEVVLPADAADRCQIEDGRDLCTLVTCTPYGINSHRLLVHAERVAYVPEEVPGVPVTAHVNRRTIPSLAMAAGIVAVGVASLAASALARRGKRPEGVVAGWQ